MSALLGTFTARELLQPETVAAMRGDVGTSNGDAPARGGRQQEGARKKARRPQAQEPIEGAILAPSLPGGSVPRGEDGFAGMRGAETVEAGESAGPGEISGEGPDLGGGDGPGGETRVPRPGADEA